MKLCADLLTWCAVGLLLWSAFRLNTTVGIVVTAVFAGCLGLAFGSFKK